MIETNQTDDDLDLKSFMETHEIRAWADERYHLEQIFRAAGLRELLVDNDSTQTGSGLHQQEPDFFTGVSATRSGLQKAYLRPVDCVMPDNMKLRTANFRPLFSFTCSAGYSERGLVWNCKPWEVNLILTRR